jgi:hypothetical protein
MVAGDFYMIIIISKDERMKSLVNILLLKHTRMYTSYTDVCVLCKKLSLLWYNTNEYNTNVFISNQGPIKGKIITMIKYMGTMCNVYTQYGVTIK